MKKDVFICLIISEGLRKNSECDEELNLWPSVSMLWHSTLDLERLSNELGHHKVHKWHPFCLLPESIWNASCEFTFYTPTSVYIFSILFSMHFLRWWQGEFVEKSRASLGEDHFLHSCDRIVWFMDYMLKRNLIQSLLGVEGIMELISLILSFSFHVT